MTKGQARGFTSAGVGTADLSALSQINIMEITEKVESTITLPFNQILWPPETYNIPARRVSVSKTK